MARTLTELVRRLKPRHARADLPPLVLMTDAERLPDPLPAVQRLPRGAAVIVRHRDPDARRDLAVALAGVCRRDGLRLLVAADPRLAVTVGADGLHLPEAMVRASPRQWSRWRRPGWLVTAAAHSPAAVRRAAAAGVDAVLLSPVFPTRSHPDASALGPLRFAAWTLCSGVPVYALGGVTPDTAARLAGSGARGFAGIDGLADHS